MKLFPWNKAISDVIYATTSGLMLDYLIKRNGSAQNLVWVAHSHKAQQSKLKNCTLKTNKLVMYWHGPVSGGSRQVSLGHCAGGTHLSPNSTRPSGQKHPGENTSQYLKYAITAWYDPYLAHTERCSLHPHPGCHKYVDKQNHMWWTPCPQDTKGRKTYIS